MLRALVPYAAYAYMTFVGLTTRLRIRGEEHRQKLRKSNQRFLYAFWHQRQVFFTWTHRNAGVSVLVSRSRDGELIARTMELSGISATRGSSSRGAASALREMIKTVEAGLDIGITPDGPKGPAREVKSGAVFLAQKLGIPILPITNALSFKLIMKSWDKFHIPLPLGKAVLRYGPPLLIGPNDDLDAKAAQLKRVLDDITAQADAEVS